MEVHSPSSDRDRCGVSQSSFWLTSHRRRTLHQVLIDTLAQAFDVCCMDEELAGSAGKYPIRQSGKIRTAARGVQPTCSTGPVASKILTEYKGDNQSVLEKVFRERKPGAPAFTSMSVITCHRSMATIQRSSRLRQLASGGVQGVRFAAQSSPASCVRT